MPILIIIIKYNSGLMFFNLMDKDILNSSSRYHSNIDFTYILVSFK